MANTDKITGETVDSSAPFAPVYRRVGDVIRDPSIWEELPRLTLEQLKDIEIVVHDAMFLVGNYPDRADNSYAIIMFATPADGPTDVRIGGVFIPTGASTALVGGEVAVRKLKQLAGVNPVGRSQLPILGRFVMRDSKVQGHQPYADFV